MKKNTGILYLLCGFFFFAYISSAIGGDRMVKEYIVKINGIEINSGSAENILSRMEGIEKNKQVKIIDENTDSGIDIESLVAIVEPGMNIRIDDSETLRDILRVFEKCSVGHDISDKNIHIISDDNREQCVFESKKNINLCVNVDNQITKVAFY